MCNRSHDDATPIKKTGVGWKLFEKIPGDKRLRQLITSGIYTNTTKNGRKVTWIDEKKDRYDYGFCFFLSRKEAIRAKKEYRYCSTVVMKKIKYEGGIGTHSESLFVRGTIQIALAKSFTIINKKNRV